MQISAAAVKELREMSGCGMMDCKNALKATDGDISKAIDWLREKGLAKAAKKAGRIAAEGVVDSYIHMGGKIGVLLELNCETDFVAATPAFKALAHDVALQIAAAKPTYVCREEVDPKEVEHERDILMAQIKEDPKMASKPQNIIDKMIDGRIEKFYKDVCLMEQPFVKNPDVTIADMINENIGKIGEKIAVRRFVRYEMGEGLEKKESNFAAEIMEQVNG